MAENGHQGAHEADRPPIRTLVIFSLALFSIIGIVLLLVGLSFGLISEKIASFEPPPSPVATSQVPPQPRLQPNPPAELRQVRAEEQKHLDSYGWVDQKAGTVRIPIGQAIDYVAAHGLPARIGAPAQPGPTPAGGGPAERQVTPEGRSRQ